MTTNETLEEQRAWVAEQFDAVVEASGVSSGWHDIYWQDVFWEEDRPEDRELLLSAFFPGGCDGVAGQLYESLINADASALPNAEDPIEAAARVRAYWESAGWTVTDLYSPPNPDSPHFLGDRADGAMLAFRASETGMSLEVGTACSGHSTVVNWQRHLDEAKKLDGEHVGPALEDPALRYAKDLSVDEGDEGDEGDESDEAGDNDTDDAAATDAG